jgi:hypothetical protein
MAMAWSTQKKMGMDQKYDPGKHGKSTKKLMFGMYYATVHLFGSTHTQIKQQLLVIPISVGYILCFHCSTGPYFC